jgi:hypothetical protein
MIVAVRSAGLRYRRYQSEADMKEDFERPASVNFARVSIGILPLLRVYQERLNRLL